MIVHESKNYSTEKTFFIYSTMNIDMTHLRKQTFILINIRILIWIS